MMGWLIWRAWIGLGFGAETCMEAPTSASLGAMGSLLQKLKELKGPPTIHQLMADLSILQDRLEKLSKVRDPSLTVKYWMKDVREISYDMEDCIDFLVNADAGAKMGWDDTISGFLTLVKEANERWSIYNLDADAGSSPTNMVVHNHLPTVFSKVVDPVGMDGPRNKLRGWMAEDEDENLKVLCILGAEGIGKTKLAELLWRELEGKFECRAFVQTAKKPDIRMILRNILSQVRPLQPVVPCAVTNLIDDVKNHLKNRRYFIVIDDLWAPSVWDVVRHAFPVNNCGSRIITTTKVDEVALACCVYNPQYIFKMKALSVDESKKLLISRTFGSGEHPGQFHKVTQEIARKCGGSPLAIIIMGSLLAIQHETVQNLEDRLKYWQYVENFLCNNLRVNATSDEILKQVLNLCYNSLPCCLKTCLLYLSVYPDNYILLKEDLVNQ
ncbi:disease resistance protein RGA5-like isoform X1 [Oryza sativa Japonica Group]|uniref:disease resistance protein RGA5-like isoform X1 n=1 Tax=Oryza sativa subsp. japonica TaxID=39947 RepID=UPI00339BDEC5